MNFKQASFALLGMSLLSGVAVAGPFYAGVNLSQINLDEQHGIHADPLAYSLNAGYVLTPGVAAELRLGDKAKSDTIDGTSVDIEANKTIGVFVRAFVPGTETITPYALLGYSNLNLKVSDGEFTEEDRDHDVSYGLGVDYKVMENAAVGVEWVDYYRKDNFYVSGYSLTGRLSF